MIKCSITTYHQYLPQLTADQKKVIKSNPSLANRIVNDSVNKNRTFRCGVCNKLILDFHGYFPRVTCSPDCMATSKKVFLGKKRPDHSAKMKVITRQLIAEGKLWGEKHRRNNKKHLTKVNASLTKEKRSSNLKSVESRRRQLVRFLDSKTDAIKFSKYYVESSFVGLIGSDVSRMSDSRVYKLIVERNSIKSSLAMDNNPNMGATAFYRRFTMSGLKFHRKGKTVRVRSTLERDFVLWLERSGISWTYEWATLRYPLSGAYHSYTPDFKILVDGEFWVVETKGFYTKTSFRKEKSKMVVCAARCRALGYKMALLSIDSIGNRGEKIDPSKWTDVASISDARLYKFMTKNIPGKTC